MTHTDPTSYVTREPGEEIKREYRVLSRAWYGAASLGARSMNPTEDEITIGHYSTDGGTTGEFQIVLIHFLQSDKRALQLTIFDDAWHLLRYEADLFRRIGELGDGARLEDVERVLCESGFVDATPTVERTAEQ